ncbi:unnamed protein product, partial [Didymodactylos carnosus]
VSLFQLERKRTEGLNFVITIIQKYTRSWHQQKLFAREMAAIRVQRAYRKYRTRTYVKKLNDAFRNVANSNDFGKNIKWPAPQPGFVPLNNKLKQMHRRWRAYKIISRIPSELRPTFELKLLAAEYLQNRTSYIANAFHQVWKGDYLSLPEEHMNMQQNLNNYKKVMNELRVKDKFSQIIFSTLATKMNTSVKMDERAIVMTDRFIYKLDPKKHFHIRKTGIPLEQITGLSVTTGTEQLIVVHSSTLHDLVFYMHTKEDRVGEFVANFIKLKRKMSSPFVINVLRYVSVQLDKHERLINIVPGGDQIEFKKGSGNNITLTAPI